MSEQSICKKAKWVGGYWDGESVTLGAHMEDVRGVVK